jgi:hypothetical protein
MSTTPQHNDPTYTLELRAADQRRRLHSSVAELRSRLDPKQLGREYVLPASGIAAMLGLVLGYGLTGMFTRH